MGLRTYLNARFWNRVASRVRYAVAPPDASSFRSIYERYKKEYEAFVASHPTPAPFVLPIWDSFAVEMERYFRTDFSIGFLAHPIIRRTMFMDFGGRSQASALEYLETHTDPDTRERLLREPTVGEPTITQWRYRASHNTIHHAQHLIKFSNETHRDLRDVRTVVEWGGGYGNLARIFRLLNAHATYILIDLPVFAYIQAVYLSAIFGPDVVRVVTDPTVPIPPGTFAIIPLDENHLRARAVRNADLFISTWALSESTNYAQQFVEEQAYFGAQALLIAHQEASEDMRYADDILTHLSGYRTVFHERIPYLKQNFYLFCERPVEQLT